MNIFKCFSIEIRLGVCTYNINMGKHYLMLKILHNVGKSTLKNCTKKNKKNYRIYIKHNKIWKIIQKELIYSVEYLMRVLENFKNRKISIN